MLGALEGVIVDGFVVETGLRLGRRDGTMVGIELLRGLRFVGLREGE